jgi:hypothetical protein
VQRAPRRGRRLRPRRHHRGGRRPDEPAGRVEPNERWQADTTHWQLADGTDVEILNIIDDTAPWSPPNRAAAAESRSNATCPPWASASSTHAPTTHRPAARSDAFHQTLKRWLTAQDPADTTDQLQAQLDAFVAWFRGRDGHCWPPPAQIPACAFNALGS